MPRPIGIIPPKPIIIPPRPILIPQGPFIRSPYDPPALPKPMPNPYLKIPPR